MRTVYRYDLQHGGRGVNLVDPKVVHVGAAPDLPEGDYTPTVWIEHTIDPLPGDLHRKVLLTFIGTGHPIPDDAPQHVGSCVIGPFCWHVYAGGLP